MNQRCLRLSSRSGSEAGISGPARSIFTQWRFEHTVIQNDVYLRDPGKWELALVRDQHPRTQLFNRTPYPFQRPTHLDRDKCGSSLQNAKEGRYHFDSRPQPQRNELTWLYARMNELPGDCVCRAIDLRV